MVDGPFGSDLKSEEYVDEGVPLIQLNNIGVGVHTASNLKFITEDKAATLARHCAVPGDLVIAKMAEPVARAAVVSNDFPRYTIVADCIKLSVDATEWLPQFLNYWMNSAVVRSIAEVYSAGITRLRINLGAVKKLPVFELPLPEQNAIADFLDRETAKIDTLVAEQEQLITLLKEKRQAVISHAVTKGLDPSVPMKDSGVEWLGEVPAHWEVGSIKRFFSVLDSRRVPLSSEERSYRQGPYPYYGASGAIDNVDDFLFDEDLILVSEDGANLLSRTTPIAFIARGKYWVNNHAHILKPCDQSLSFWCERIECIDLAPVITGAAQPKLTIDALANLPIAVPPEPQERAAIDLFLQEQAQPLQGLIDQAEQGIALLQERRSALISAAVTGQIDVRGLDTAKEAA